VIILITLRANLIRNNVLIGVKSHQQVIGIKLISKVTMVFDMIIAIVIIIIISHRLCSRRNMKKSLELRISNKWNRIIKIMLWMPVEESRDKGYLRLQRQINRGIKIGNMYNSSSSNCSSSDNCNYNNNNKYSISNKFNTNNNHYHHIATLTIITTIQKIIKIITIKNTMKRHNSSTTIERQSQKRDSGMCML